MEQENNKKKNKFIYIIIGFVLVIGMIIAGTFAYYTWVSNVNKMVAINTAPGLDEYVIYEEGASVFSGSWEVSSDYTGGRSTTFSIGKKASASKINLVAYINMEVKAIGTNIASSSAVKWAITSGETLLGEGSFNGKSDGDDITLLSDITLSTTLNTYTVWLWIDEAENPSSELSGETLDVGITVQVDNIELLPIGIYLIDNRFNVANLSSDLVGGMYRFQGTASAVTNNYICFGTDDLDTCTGDTDKYMYRIIGVTPEGQLKLIKKEAVYSSYWYSSSSGTYLWNNSLIYSSVNGSSYLTNSTYFPTGWSDKVELRDWKYGTLSTTNVDQNGIGVYDIENAFTSTVNAKIGLMYVHDYYLAYNNTENFWWTEAKGWIHIDNNDSAPPSSMEWLMTYHGYGTNTSGTTAYYSWYVMDTGAVGRRGQHYDQLSVRPVFYLNADEQVVDGSGTSSDPYMLRF